MPLLINLQQLVNQWLRERLQGASDLTDGFIAYIATSFHVLRVSTYLFNYDQFTFNNSRVYCIRYINSNVLEHRKSE